jgi:hypothetical protein
MIGGESWGILVPIAAIVSVSASKVMRTWIRFRETQRKLGVSTVELEREVVALTRSRDELIERLQNLEAIVVSQTWSALHERDLPPAERELKVASAVRRELAPPDPSTANRQRAEQLASRLR